jgi:cytochrome oxidase Cu insertion factor (SCO1/SenC/PrrC family)
VGGVLLTVATLAAVFALVQLTRSEAGRQPLPIFSTVADFTLTNQAGRAVSLADLRGHVWVADIIFTRCAGPCLKMSRQMKELQQAMPPASGTKLVSLTTDPEFDTPPVLTAYAKRFDADAGRWWFLTGARNQITALARDSLKLIAMEKEPGERETPQDLFIHSTYLVVVDRQGRVRAVFETSPENEEPAQVRARLLATVRRLEREP